MGRITDSICSPENSLPPSTVSGGGKQKKLITYMTFADGRRVVAPTWPRSRYEGLANMEVGSRIRVLYEENRSGTLCIRRVVLMTVPNGSAGINVDKLI